MRRRHSRQTRLILSIEDAAEGVLDWRGRQEAAAAVESASTPGAPHVQGQVYIARRVIQVVSGAKRHPLTQRDIYATPYPRAGGSASAGANRVPARAAAALRRGGANLASSAARAATTRALQMLLDTSSTRILNPVS